MSYTFSRGIHPQGNKYLTENKNIERILEEPKEVFIPLSQHIGAPAEMICKVGEVVKCGQLIAKAVKGLSANIYSSISGVVKGVVKRPSVMGIKIDHIHILNDFKEDTLYLPPLKNPDGKEIIERCLEAGIVGMGGATFPTFIKLNPPSDKIIDTLVINGAECEPYITCDYRIMIEYTREFLEGVRFLRKASKAKNCIIGIENNKLLAVDLLSKEKDVVILGDKKYSYSKEELEDEKRIEVKVLKTKYPQGAEKQLIFATTKRKVPEGALPHDVGVLVNNVHTALSVYEAVSLGKPLYERVMTISGLATKNPTNTWCKIGTLYNDLAEVVGVEDDLEMIISGGPMMGFSVYNEDTCTTKGTSSLLFLKKEEINLEMASNCIGCGKCAKVCPMKLMPMFIDSNVLTGDLKEAKRYGALNCIECGSCAYVCPAKRPLVQSIKVAKKLIKERGIK